jgi:hypothetical protein
LEKCNSARNFKVLVRIRVKVYKKKILNPLVKLTTSTVITRVIVMPTLGTKI